MPRYKLSELNLPAPQLGRINILMAPAGSGKTTWSANQPTNNKALLFTAPLTSIVNQTITSGKFHPILDAENFYLTNSTLFGVPNSLYFATTTQSLTCKLISKSYKASSIGTIIIDEFDMAIDYGMLGFRQKQSNHMMNLFQQLHILCEDHLVILMSATLTPQTVKWMEQPFIKEKISFIRDGTECDGAYSIEASVTQTFSSLGDIHVGQRKTAVYCKSVRTMLRVKEQMEKKGYKVGMLKSATGSTNVYDMTEYDCLVRDTIMEKEMVPDDLDVLVFNQAFERGVTLVGEQFGKVFVWSENEVEQIQASARFRDDGMELYWKKEVGGQKVEKEEVGVKSWLGEFMDKEAKKEFIKLLPFRRSSGNVLSWKGARERLEKMGFVVKDSTQTINKKRVRGSVVSMPPINAEDEEELMKQQKLWEDLNNWLNEIDGED